MSRKLVFGDNSTIEISISIPEEGKMATLAYQKLIDFIDDELADDPELSIQADEDLFLEDDDLLDDDLEEEELLEDELDEEELDDDEFDEDDFDEDDFGDAWDDEDDFRSPGRKWAVY